MKRGLAYASPRSLLRRGMWWVGKGWASPLDPSTLLRVSGPSPVQSQGIAPTGKREREGDQPVAPT